MARSNPIKAIMEAELPNITYQRRKLFRPSFDDTLYVYKIINQYTHEKFLKFGLI